VYGNKLFTQRFSVVYMLRRREASWKKLYFKKNYPTKSFKIQWKNYFTHWNSLSFVLTICFHYCSFGPNPRNVMSLHWSWSTSCHKKASDVELDIMLSHHCGTRNKIRLFLFRPGWSLVKVVMLRKGEHSRRTGFA
jgi:hypothetical protein